MTVLEILGKRLTAWRKKRGEPLKNMALAIGVSQAAISNWERGRRFPSGVHLDALSSYTGIPVHCLLCPAAETCSRNGDCTDAV